VALLTSSFHICVWGKERKRAMMKTNEDNCKNERYWNCQIAAILPVLACPAINRLHSRLRLRLVFLYLASRIVHITSETPV